MEEDLILDGKKFVTTAEAGKRLNFTSYYITSFCRAGDLSCKKIGKSWLVEEDSLLDFKKKKELEKEEKKNKLKELRKAEYKNEKVLASQKTKEETLDKNKIVHELPHASFQYAQHVAPTSVVEEINELDTEAEVIPSEVAPSEVAPVEILSKEVTQKEIATSAPSVSERVQKTFEETPLRSIEIETAETPVKKFEIPAVLREELDEDLEEGDKEIETPIEAEQESAPEEITITPSFVPNVPKAKKSPIKLFPSSLIKIPVKIPTTLLIVSAVLVSSFYIVGHKEELRQTYSYTKQEILTAQNDVVFGLMSSLSYFYDEVFYNYNAVTAQVKDTFTGTLEYSVNSLLSLKDEVKHEGKYVAKNEVKNEPKNEIKNIAAEQIGDSYTAAVTVVSDSVSSVFYSLQSEIGSFYSTLFLGLNSLLTTVHTDIFTATTSLPDRITTYILDTYDKIISFFINEDEFVLVSELEKKEEPIIVDTSTKSIPTEDFKQTEQQTQTITTSPYEPTTRPTTKPPTERITKTERIIVQSGVTELFVLTKLEQLNNKLRSEIYKLSEINAGNIINNYNVISQTNKIDKLSRVTLNNTTITGTFSGLTDAHVPDSITASNYLPLSGGTLTGPLTISSAAGTTTFGGTTLYIKEPTIAHTFSSWATGVSNSAYSDAALVINPDTATADSNLISASVGGSVKFLIDAEGDVFTNSLTSVGGVTLSTTTASTFAVEGDTTLGDAETDTTTINGALIVQNASATSTFMGDLTIGTISPDSGSRVQVELRPDQHFYIDAVSQAHTGSRGAFRVRMNSGADNLKPASFYQWSNGYNASRVLNLNLYSNAMTTEQINYAQYITLDDAGSSGGEMEGIRLDTTNSVTAVEKNAFHIGSGFTNVIELDIGTNGTLDSALTYDDSTLTFATTTSDFNSAASNISFFEEINDLIYIGETATFNEIKVSLSNPATKDINMTVEYSTGVGTWSTLNITDGTNGFRSNGVIPFNPPLDWVSASVNGDSKFWVRIKRTKSGNVGTITESTIMVSSPDIVKLTGEGKALFAGGTAASSTYSFYDDSDTGMFSATANALGFATNGIEALTIDSSQNATFAGDVVLSGSTATLGNDTSTDSLHLFGGSSITNGGSILLRGSSVGNEILVNIQGGTRMTANSTGVTFNEDSADLDFRVESDNDTHALFVQGSDGNVGIGTADPSTKLNVVDSSFTPQIIVQTNETDATTKVGSIGGGHYTNSEEPVGMIYYSSDANNNQVYIGGGTLSAVNSAQQIRFYTGATKTTINGTERMRIDSSGNVGIGSSGPDRRLDILDAANPQLRLSNTDGSIFTDFQVAASTGDLTIDLNPNTTATDIFMTQTGGTTGVNLRVCEGSACPSITINNGGNVLVENAVYFGNGFRIDQVVGTTTEIAVYGVTATTTPIIIFDEF